MNRYTRPYVIINGKNSRMVEGLVIQSLPAVTKPPVRVTHEELPGVDGDFPTAEGYGAYDKALLIGLAGRYDVDEVISFFDASGTAIFSNEPDKYYDFAVYSQIDFERLLRFRTATVEMHVQPFKYSAVRDRVEVAPDGTEAVIYNRGNVVSKPRYVLPAIRNSTDTEIEVNGKKFKFARYAGATLDSERMNAYGSSGSLLNGFADGDFRDLWLEPGRNEVSIKMTNLESAGGDARAAVVRPSRWI